MGDKARMRFNSNSPIRFGLIRFAVDIISSPNWRKLVRSDSIWIRIRIPHRLQLMAFESIRFDWDSIRFGFTLGSDSVWNRFVGLGILFGIRFLCWGFELMGAAASCYSIGIRIQYWLRS